MPNNFVPFNKFAILFYLYFIFLHSTIISFPEHDWNLQHREFHEELAKSNFNKDCIQIENVFQWPKKNLYTGFEKNVQPKIVNSLGKELDIAIVIPIKKQNNSEESRETDEQDVLSTENHTNDNLPIIETNQVDTVILGINTENMSNPNYIHDAWVFDDEIYVSDEDDYYVLNNLPIPICDSN